MHADRLTATAGRHALVVAGGSSGTGALVASLARGRGHEVRVADAPGCGHCLRVAIAGAAAVVLVPMRGTESVAAQAHAVLEACPEASASAPHVVLVSGFSAGHGLAHALNTPERLTDLLSAERMVRSSGRSYTILRPTWLTNDPPGRYRLTLTQEPWADGMIPRADLARICLAAIAEPSARGKTFAAFAEPGPSPTRWARLFAALTADEPVLV
jgi:NAD(P)H-binding